MNKGLIVFLLGVGTTFAYGIFSFWAFLETSSENQDRNKSEAGESTHAANLEEIVVEVNQFFARCYN